VSVAVERDGDRAVAHVAAECLGVDAGGDRVGGVGVAAFVQPERRETGGLPGAPRFGGGPGRRTAESDRRLGRQSLRPVGEQLCA
jgi:hypothetical protein